jgi:hypothetical protein
MFYLVKCYKNTSFVGVITASGLMVKFILSSIMGNTTLNLVAILKTAKPCKHFSYKFLSHQNVEYAKNNRLRGPMLASKEFANNLEIKNL